MVNLFATMTIVGLWHGAGWTFIIWGMLHGAYLVIHKTYEKFVSARLTRAASHMYNVLTHALTFVCIVFAWGWFRALSVDQGISISGNLFGFSNASHFYALSKDAFIWLIAGYAICVTMPSSMAMFKMAQQEGPIKVRFKPGLAWAGGIAFICATSFLMFSRVSEFIYFQF